MSAQNTLASQPTPVNQADAMKAHREIINQSDLALAFQDMDSAIARLDAALIAMRNRPDLVRYSDRVAVLASIEQIEKVRNDLLEVCAGRIQGQTNGRAA